MRTLDIADTAQEGVLILSGFGADRPETAIYLDGKLIEQTRDGLEAEHPAIQLAQALAQRAGVDWKERQTHVWWRFIHRCEDAPQTLAHYDAVTFETFQHMTVKKYADFFDARSGLPADYEVETAIVSLCYEMSGGDIEQFEAWYGLWTSQMMTFLDPFHTNLQKLYELENSSDPEAFDISVQRLKGQFKDYLLKVYAADKPLDPVAQRAQLSL